jgi:threonyl-tRNA synthetase
VRAGSNEVWDRAEAVLEAAAQAAGIAYRVDEGEGAFYGPKLDFHLRDSHGRAWQCGTVQLDLVLPERFDANYISSDGRRVRPVMIHHAVLGSIERFIAILLEHHGGDLPLWLAPEQVAVANITAEVAGYAHEVAGELDARGLRVVVDDRSDRVSKKIVDAREAGIPILIAVGKREANERSVSIRRRDGTQQAMPLGDAADTLHAEATRRHQTGQRPSRIT